MFKTRDVLVAALTGIFIPAAVFMISLIPQGERHVGVVENIDGIPFPLVQGSIHISEKLAHADIYLTEPVAFKNLTVTVTFDPQELEELAIGIRENSFWLSYPKESMYMRGEDTEGLLTKQVVIPLTDKIQEPDRSVDLMFFATHRSSTDEVDEKAGDRTAWILHDVTAELTPAMPTRGQFKDYVRSIVKKERAL